MSVAERITLPDYQHTLARIGQAPASNRMYSHYQTFFTSWREVTGNIQNDLRQARRVGVDLAVDVGLGCHVGGSVWRVQRRHSRLTLAVEPQRQVAVSKSISAMAIFR
jgi:hypothetical protein